MEIVLQEQEQNGPSVSEPSSNFVPTVKLNRLTKHVAMDCEVVNGVDWEILARVYIVNILGHCIYDKYVKPTAHVVEYNGINPQDLQNGESFHTVRQEVAFILEGRILVGHEIVHNLKILYLSHPQVMIRDTQSFLPFKILMNSEFPNLKKLFFRVFGFHMQEGEQSSVENAEACMELYVYYQGLWERDSEDSGITTKGYYGNVINLHRLTRHLAINCEMISGDDGEILSRVSIVNKFGECVYDKYVKPSVRIADNIRRTSGIIPQYSENGESLETVRNEVMDIIKGKVLLGHAIHNVLKVLVISHPLQMIRDTQSFKAFKALTFSNRPSLKELALHVLGTRIQGGVYSSVNNAETIMLLYQLRQKEWEADRHMIMRTLRPDGKLIKLTRLSKHIAIDWETVGYANDVDMISRVTIVNKFGECVYDKFVKPTQPVEDYGGRWPREFRNGELLQTILREVAEILQGRIVVGHGILKNLRYIFLSHPHRMIRDTQRYKPFMTLMNSKRPSLKELAFHLLGIRIQVLERCSLEDAQTTMKLYRLYQYNWEREIDT